MTGSISGAFNMLAESDRIIAGHVYEEAYLIFKDTGLEVALGDFYGNPACALIDPHSEWCLIGGIYLLLWNRHAILRFPETVLSDIYDMRIAGKGMVHILTDPWAEHAAIWELNLVTEKLVLMRKFDEYNGKPYTDNVMW